MKQKYLDTIHLYVSVNYRDNASSSKYKASLSRDFLENTNTLTFKVTQGQTSVYDKLCEYSSKSPALGWSFWLLSPLKLSLDFYVDWSPARTPGPHPGLRTTINDHTR